MNLKRAIIVLTFYTYLLTFYLYSYICSLDDNTCDEETYIVQNVIMSETFSSRVLLFPAFILLTEETLTREKNKP